MAKKRSQRDRTVAKKILGRSPVRHYHQLSHISGLVEEWYLFNTTLPPYTIKWMGVRRSNWRNRNRREMNLGLCVIEDNLILINRALNNWWVPPYVVEGVVLHELLHLIYLPTYNATGSIHNLHPPAFLAAEQKFAVCAKADGWTKRNIDRLLAFRAR